MLQWALDVIEFNLLKRHAANHHFQAAYWEAKQALEMLLLRLHPCCEAAKDMGAQEWATHGHFEAPSHPREGLKG